MGEYPLGEAFSLLGVDNMVKLLTCTLLETQILLYSQGQRIEVFEELPKPQLPKHHVGSRAAEDIMMA